jgi:hypothetical protein
MAGNRFLNSYLKIVICVLGMAVMGYFLYPAIEAGTLTDKLNLIRGLVFIGFAYLFVQSVKEVL